MGDSARASEHPSVVSSADPSTPTKKRRRRRRKKRLHTFMDEGCRSDKCTWMGVNGRAGINSRLAPIRKMGAPGPTSYGEESHMVLHHQKSYLFSNAMYRYVPKGRKARSTK